MKNSQTDVQGLETIIFDKTGKSKENPYFLVTNLSSEVGELADEVIGLEGERIEDKEYKDKSPTSKEIVDVIINAIRIANHYQIELSEAWTKRIDEIKAKFS
jgi:NTP pyrophosphatase (non-canonical NTP hydrolase)